MKNNTYNDRRRDRAGSRTLEEFGITPTMIGEALDAVIKGAERYEWLRQSDWWSSPLRVVRNPKEQSKPGTDCPSRDRLDSAIDAAIAKESHQ